MNIGRRRVSVAPLRRAGWRAAQVNLPLYRHRRERYGRQSARQILHRGRGRNGNTAALRGELPARWAPRAIRNAMHDAGLTPDQVDGMLSYHGGDSTPSTAIQYDLGIRPNFYMDCSGGGVVHGGAGGAGDRGH